MSLSQSFLLLAEGDQTLGRGRHFWLYWSAVVIAFAAFGAAGDSFSVGNATYLLLWVFMAMGLCVLWGCAGVLSFGQTAFFGIGGYTYGILSANWGPSFTLLALGAAVAGAALCAAAIGYFLFYGGVSGVFVGIVTLAISLALEAFLAQTAGPEWTIGKAMLGGFNGMTDALPLSLPWQGDAALDGHALFFCVFASVIVVYLLLRILLNSRFGDALSAIRNNPVRAATLGIDVPFNLLLAFALAGMLAGLSGALYTAWGQYITPDSMGLNAAVLPIVLLAVSGRKDLSAVTMGSLAILVISQQLSVYGSQYALVAQSVVLIASIFLFPDGMLLSPALWFAKRTSRAGQKKARPARFRAAPGADAK